MSKNKVELLDKFERIFAKNPESKVFAPLAEVHRSFGDIETALEILKKGFRYHSEYSLGRLILGKCYFDQGKFDLALSAISEIAKQERDNLSLQQVYARTLRQLEKNEEALAAYKLVLFLNPRDEEAQEFIENFEDVLLLGNDEPAVKLEESLFDVPIDDWVSVDFTREQMDQVEESTEAILGRFKQEIEEENFEVEEPGLESTFLKQDFDFKDDSILPEQYQYSDSVESLKLINLYCAQGAFEKAYEALAKILDKNPNDTNLLSLYAELKIVIEKNLDCAPLYKLKLKLSQLNSRIKDLDYENSYY